MISETCKKLGIPFSHTSKLFYGEMVAGLTINVPFREPRRENYKSIGNYCKKLMDYRKNRTAFMLKILGENDWDYKVNQNSISYYFSTQHDLNQIVSDLVANGHAVTRVVAPRNDDDVEFLENNPNKVIREKLFRGKYRFKIELKRSYTNQETITTLLHSMFGGELSEAREATNLQSAAWAIPELKISDERAYYNNTQTLYVAEIEDVFLTRISINEFIHRIEEVVLKEVSNEGSIAAEAY